MYIYYSLWRKKICYQKMFNTTHNVNFDLFCVFSVVDVFINFFVLVTANTYDYIVDQQPIGRELFRLYCCRKPQLARAIQFLDRVVKISLV